MTLTSDIDRFTISHYGSGAFRTNDTIAMEQANRWANRSLVYRSNRSFNMPPPGLPRAFDTFAVPGRREFDYQSLPGGGEFELHP